MTDRRNTAKTWGAAKAWGLRGLLLAACWLLALGLPAGAQTLAIKGLSDTPASLDLAAVEGLGTIEVTDTREVSAPSGRERVTITYRGVELVKLLEAQGIERLDRYALRGATVLVVAKDGYKASFSWGELFNTAGGRRVVMVLGENGRPNSEREGVFALRSFSDLRPGPRHVRDVAELRLLLPGD